MSTTRNPKPLRKLVGSFTSGFATRLIGPKVGVVGATKWTDEVNPTLHWVAAKDFNLADHNTDIYQIVWFLNNGNSIYAP